MTFSLSVVFLGVVPGGGGKGVSTAKGATKGVKKEGNDFPENTNYPTRTGASNPCVAQGFWRRVCKMRNNKIILVRMDWH